MGLVLGTYQPNVQCRGFFSNWVSCRGIVGDMPVLTTPEIFGPADDPAVQIILPHTLEAGSSRPAICFKRTALTAHVVSPWRPFNLCTANLWKRKSGRHILVQDLGSGVRHIRGLHES